MSSTGKATLFVAVWEWKNCQGAWCPYSPEVSQLLERGHHKHLSSLLLGDADPCLAPYTVSLSLMSQRHSETGVEKPVRRTFLSQRSPAGSGVVWQWGSEEDEEAGDPQQWHDYTMPVQCVVEDAWVQGGQTVDISNFFPEYPFIVDFCNLTQHHLENGVQRHVRRQKQASYPVARPPPGYVYPSPVPAVQNNNTLGRREQRLKMQQKQQQQRLQNEPVKQQPLKQSCQPPHKHKTVGNSTPSLSQNKKQDPSKHKKDAAPSNKSNGGGRQLHCFSLRQVLPDNPLAGDDDDDSYYPSSTEASRNTKSSTRASADELRQPLMPGVASSSNVSASQSCGGVVVVAKQQQQHHQNKTVLASNGTINNNKSKKGQLNKHKSSTSNEKSGSWDGTNSQSVPSALLSKVLSFGLHHSSSNNSNQNNHNNNCYNSSPSSRSSSSNSSRLAYDERQYSSSTPSPPPPLPHRLVVGGPPTLSSLPPLHCSTPLPVASSASAASASSSDSQTKVKNLLNVKKGYHQQYQNHTPRSNDCFSVHENAINQRKLEQNMVRGHEIKSCAGFRPQNPSSSDVRLSSSAVRGHCTSTSPAVASADYSDRSSDAKDRLGGRQNKEHFQHPSVYNSPHNPSHSRARSLDPATTTYRNTRQGGHDGSTSNSGGKLPPSSHSLSRPGSPRTDAWTTPTATPASQRRRGTAAMGSSFHDGRESAGGLSVSSPPTPLPRTVIPPTPLPRKVLPAALLPRRSPSQS